MVPLMVTFTYRNRCFSADRSGAIAPLFAIFLVALLLTCGITIDYSLGSSAKTRLQNAADAAALAVVAAAARSDGDEQALEAAKNNGYRIYEEFLADDPSALRRRPDITLQYVQGRYDATVSYAIERDNIFAVVLPSARMPIQGTSTASQAAQFVDLHLMLDVSASMGLGASEDDQRRLMEQTGCQFGCHVAESGTSNEQNAVNLGIPMRIDVLKSATQQFLDDMGAHPTPDMMRIALHVFHDRADQILAPTADLDQASNLVRSLRLGMTRPRVSTVPAEGNTPDSGDTQPNVMAQHAANTLDHQGNGTRGDPRKFLVIVTDGTESTWSPWLVTKAWDTDACQEIHDLGIEVAVIYLEYDYYGKATDATWPWTIEPIESQIEPNLRACANSGLYIKANDPAEIHAAFSRMFREVANKTAVRLTN